MAKKLVLRTDVFGRDGIRYVAGTSESKIPEEAQIGDHAFVDPDVAEAAGEPDAGTTIPPKSGRGSSRDAWAAYAEANGIDVDADATKDDIIAALDAEGVATE